MKSYPNTAERLLRRNEVLARTGLSKATQWRYEKVGRFPASVRLGPRAIRWRESEILAWMATLERSSPAANIAA